MIKRLIKPRVKVTTIRRYLQSTSQTFRSHGDEKFYGSPRLSANSHLSPLQSLSLAIYSATKAYIDPERHDMVALLAEVTGKFALENMYQTMLNDPTGRRILQDRPLVTKESVDIEKLKKMPKNTFGYGYAEFLNKHGFDPDGRAKVQYISNPDLAYVMTRYR